MKRALARVLVAATACAIAATGDGQGVDGEPRLVTVAPGVVAALQPAARRFDDSNATIVRLGSGPAGGLLVVDSQATPAATRRLIAEIRARFAEPVRYLVNTHWHGDHTLGNQAYREAFPGVEIVAHASVAEDIEGRAIPQLGEEIAAWEEAIAAAEARLAAGVDREGAALDAEGEATLTRQLADAREKVAEKRALVDLAPRLAPTLTFEDRLVIERGGRRVELMQFEAHTRGDVVVYLPAEKVLVTGDLLDDLPFAGHGYPGSWIATLDTLDELEVEAIVPGHGPVFRDKARLGHIRDLLRAARQQAAAAVAVGHDLEAFRAAADLARFRPLFVDAGDDYAARNFDAFLPALLERVHAEAAGTLE